ncbi:MAG: FG-GAP repeat protein [Planctomycetota bacterium JB042]
MKLRASRSLVLAAVLVPLGRGADTGTSCRLPLVPIAEAAGWDGYASALDASGPELLVSAHGLRAAYVFENVGGSWVERARIDDPAGAAAGTFASAVQLDGDRLALSSSAFLSAGPVHVFERKGTTWTLRQSLLEPGLAFLDRFGASLALDGDHLLVAAKGHDADAGAVFAYRRDSKSGDYGLVQVIEVDDGGAFGADVAIDGDVAVVGASEDDEAGVDAGAIYVLEWAEKGWEIVEKLRPDDLGLVPAAGDGLGARVAIADPYVFAGAHLDDVGVASDAGSVAVAVRGPNGKLSGHAVLNAPLMQDGDRFGEALDARRSGDEVRVIVGAPSGDLLPLDNSAAHVFRAGVAGGKWEFVARLRENCSYPDYSTFGEAVVLTPDLQPLVGAPGRPPYPDPGRLIPFSTNTPGGFLCLCPCDNAAHVAAYGEGKAGTHGVPTLTSAGPPVLGQKSGLRLANALPGAQPLLFTGLGAAEIPFDGGALLVKNSLVIALPAVPPSGEIEIPIAPPDDATFCGLTLHHQAMFVDPAASGFVGTAQTAGLSRTFGS